jgi:hypothetical protein
MVGTVATVQRTKGGGIRALRFSCVGDAADGTIPATVIPSISGLLLAIETNPGGTAPTANYDVTLVDANGHDVLEGVGADRHTSNTEKAAIVFTGTSTHPPVAGDDALTLTFANQAVNSAIIEVVLYYLGQPA